MPWTDDPRSRNTTCPKCGEPSYSPGPIVELCRLCADIQVETAQHIDPAVERTIQRVVARRKPLLDRLKHWDTQLPDDPGLPVWLMGARNTDDGTASNECRAPDPDNTAGSE